MDQNQTDRHLTKNFSSQCRVHPAQTPKYYCSDANCRTSLCHTCMKTHSREHLPNITTIEEVKSQTLNLLKKGTLSRFDRFLDDMLKSGQMNDLFKETFGNLMQQNSTVDLDSEDIADILADTLERKYFHKGIVVTKKIQEDISVKCSSKSLIAFDYQFDDSDDEDHEENAQEFCQSSSDYYCRDELGSFYAKSKRQVVFWNNEDQTLLCKDITTFKSKKYNIPTNFQFLTAIESEGELLFVTALENHLTIYSIEQVNNASLELRQEFSLQEEIAFLASDHATHLFVVTEGESGLKASIYALKSQNNGLELQRLFSFEPFDLPKKVLFDRSNNLLFIQGADFLEIYKYRAALIGLLQVIFKFKTADFKWHQTTQRLLVNDARRLYQFAKGRFRLIRTLQAASRSLELTNRGILCVNQNTPGLFLSSQKNPNQQKSLILPLIDPEMDRLQNKSGERFYREGCDHDVEPKYGHLITSCKTTKVIAETPIHLFIFAYLTYYQSASQKAGYDSWSPFGGTIYCKYLLRYDFSQKKFQVIG